LLGQSLYYLLTTGSGQQTLGEEYCDISQVIAPFSSLPLFFLFFFSAVQLFDSALCFIFINPIMLHQVASNAIVFQYIFVGHVLLFCFA